jgi:uncharacterized cupredoxin-like copper-binding protein
VVRQQTLLTLAIALMAIGAIGALSSHAVEAGSFDPARGFMLHRSEMGSMHGGGAMHGRDGHPQGLAPTIPGAPTVIIVAAEFGFEPARLEVGAGSDFNLTFDNRGELYHDLVIRRAGVHLGAEPGQTVTGGVGGLPAGEYEVFCSVPGHAQAGMTALLMVTPG